jgi:hypothetical protein
MGEETEKGRVDEKIDVTKQREGKTGWRNGRTTGILNEEKLC